MEQFSEPKYENRTQFYAVLKDIVQGNQIEISFRLVLSSTGYMGDEAKAFICIGESVVVAHHLFSHIHKISNICVSPTS